jgi:putative membrane protein
MPRMQPERLLMLEWHPPTSPTVVVHRFAVMRNLQQSRDVTSTNEPLTGIPNETISRDDNLLRLPRNRRPGIGSIGWRENGHQFRARHFVKQVAISDMFEIESSKLAAQKADAETKKFASKMVADHTKASTELKAMVKGLDNAPLPTAMDSSHQGKLDKLKGLSGDQFTKQYRADQMAAHKDAVSLFDRYAKGGDNEKLKGWAAKTLPGLQHHLEMAEALNK